MTPDQRAAVSKAIDGALSLYVDYYSAEALEAVTEAVVKAITPGNTVCGWELPAWVTQTTHGVLIRNATPTRPPDIIITGEPIVSPVPEGLSGGLQGLIPEVLTAYKHGYTFAVTAEWAARNRDAFGLLPTPPPDPTTVPRVCEHCRLVTGGHDEGCITQVATSLTEHIPVITAHNPGVYLPISTDRDTRPDSALPTGYAEILQRSEAHPEDIAVPHLPHTCGCAWPTPTYDDDGVERCSGCRADA